MTLRKITIDKSVRYIPKSEQTKEREIKPKTIKAGSLSRKKTKKIHKTIKSFLIMFQHQDLDILQKSNYTWLFIQFFEY